MLWRKNSRIPSAFGFSWGCGGFSVNTAEREMAESAGLVKDTGFVRDFKPGLSKNIGEFYAKYKGLESKAEQIAATDEPVELLAKSTK